MKKLKLAIIGIEHIHATLLFREFSTLEDKFEWLGCADIPPEVGDKTEPAVARKERNLAGCDIKLFDDYKELLSLKPDLAIVCSNIKDYPRVVEETLSLNIHTLVEKPMAINFEGGRRMYEAYKKSKAILFINWPVAWFPSFKKAKELVDSGIIGKLQRFRYTNPATLGPYPVGKYSEKELLDMFWYNRALGGGVSIDYSGYGAMLATWFFEKQAESAVGIRKNFNLKFSDVEDYISYFLDFGEGVAQVEASWSTVNSGEIPTGPILYGDKGVIVADRYISKVKVYTEYSHFFTEPDMVYETENQSPNMRGLAENIYEHLVNGGEINPLITPEFNIKALAAMDAGIRSTDSGKEEKTFSVEE